MYLRGPLLILPTAALAPGTQNDRRQPFHRSKPWDLERGTIAVSRSIVPNPGPRNAERSLSAVPSFQTLAPGTWNDRCQPVPSFQALFHSLRNNSTTAGDFAHRARSIPQLLRREARALDQRLKLGPHDRRVDAAIERALGEAAIGADHHVLASDQVGETHGALGDQLGMLDY